MEIEETILDIQKDLPQLIVALDSPDKSANYVHITHTKEENTYYCPCCKEEVIPITTIFNQDNKWHPQAHFRHLPGNKCSEEAQLHYLLKMWLFEKGCNFKINDSNYTVSEIEIEKTLHTKFGDYRPDIIVNTEENKIFYFEIKYSNKKSELYIPKWDELDNDVVEVDVKYFINQKNENDIPEFSLIYSDGECFIKSYSKSDYNETIATLKEYWKRQDILDYKILWERLDWFWNELCNYKSGKSSSESLMETFSILQLYDMGVCWDLVFNKSSCLKSLKTKIRGIINNKSREYFACFVNEIKEKYKGILKNINYECKEKNCVCLRFEFEDKYKLSSNYYFKERDLIYRENREWILHPDTILCFIDEFNSKEIIIRQHLIEFEKVNDFIHCNAVIRNELLYLSDENINIKLPMYFNDSEQIINFIRNKCVEEISDIYERRHGISDYEAWAILERNLKSINKYYFHIFEEDWIHRSEYNLKYDGKYVFKFVIEDHSIVNCMTGNSLTYEMSKESLIDEFVSEEIAKTTADIDIKIRMIDAINDIRRYNNSHWSFDIDIENYIFIIAFDNLVPAYDTFTKRLLVTNSVNIPAYLLQKFDIFNYKKNLIGFLDNIVAPQMQQLIEEEKEKYNKTHINSVLFLKSEVKKYDK